VSRFLAVHAACQRLLHAILPSRYPHHDRTQGSSASVRLNKRQERRASHVGSLPLGIYFHDGDAVSLVWAKVEAGQIVVLQTVHVPFSESDTERKNQSCTKILLDIVRERQIPERRCVIGIHPTDIATRPIEVVRGMTQKQLHGNALLESGRMVPFPEEERVLAIDPIPGEHAYRMLSVAKKSEVDRLQRIVADAALVPHAIDGPLAAWARLCPDTDAVLDLSHDRPALVFFRSQTLAAGKLEELPPKMNPERVATEVHELLRKARQDGIKDVARMMVYGPSDIAMRVRAKLSTLDDALQISPLVIGGIESPPWAYALALATWEYEPPLEVAA